MLRIANVTKRFVTADGTVGAIEDLSVTVEDGEYFVLLGHSGCGKTTLLRSIAGLERPDAGEIVLGDRVFNSSERGIFVEPEDRNIAMVFQSYAIWPHMSLWDNVAFPLQEERPRRSRKEIAARVEEILDIVNLGVVARRSAASLSGGQQQRVALARALVRHPNLLLMDEPLSNLDAKLRDRMRHEIRRITRAIGVTTVHVTHDQTEAMALADRMAVMGAGHIIECGSPEQLYERPEAAFVADFLGQMNWLEGTVTQSNGVETSIGLVACEVASMTAGAHVNVGIRPEHLELSRTARGVANEYEARILDHMFLGDSSIYRVRIRDVEFFAKTGGTPLPGGAAFAVIKESDPVVFDRVVDEYPDSAADPVPAGTAAEVRSD